MSENHTPTPWEIYDCPIADASAAKDELAYQVDHTEPVGPTLYLLNAGGKCPALTGCGPSSKANAELIVTAVNSYASSQAEIERLKKALSALLIQALQSPLNSPAHEWGWEAIQGAIAAFPDFAALPGGKP